MSFFAIIATLRMPPKSRKQQLSAEKASAARDGKKRARIDEPAQEEPLIAPTLIASAEETTASTSAVHAEDPTETDCSDATFDPEQDAGAQAVLTQFVEDWVLTLDRENTISLPLFLTYNFVSLFNFSYTKAAEYVGIMISKSERTVRQWHTDFRENSAILDSKQGRYQRSGILWSSEQLNKKVTEYVRQNSNVKGKPNLTTQSLCRWINEKLLPNKSLKPGFPRHISVETSRKWLHELGFEVLSGDKGMFFDGHE